MPELPEVEMQRRYVEAHALGKRILGVGEADAAVLEGVTREALVKALQNRRFDKTHRHGKWLFIHTDGGLWLVMHFGMTGGLFFGNAGKVPPHVRFRVDFGGNTALRFLAEKRWGPDPALPGFDEKAFRKALAGRNGLLKGALLNQRVIAGIGNLYADEMLFQAGLHPETRTADLKASTFERLYEAMQEVFAASLGADTDYAALPEKYLLRHRDITGCCPKCGRALSKMAVCGRTTYYCARHQRRRC